MERGPGARTDLQPDNTMLTGSKYKSVLDDNGISYMAAQRAGVAEKIANMPQGARTDNEHSPNLDKVSIPQAAKMK